MTLILTLALTVGTAALSYALGYSHGKQDGIEEWSKISLDGLEKVVTMVNSLLAALEERSE